MPYFDRSMQHLHIRLIKCIGVCVVVAFEIYFRYTYIHIYVYIVGQSQNLPTKILLILKFK